MSIVTMLAALAPAAPHWAAVPDKFGHVGQGIVKFGHVGQGIVKSPLWSAAATAATAQAVTHTSTCPAALTNIPGKRDFGKNYICISCMSCNLSLVSLKCRFGYR